MNEADIIRAIASRQPRSKAQLNPLFECDAELLPIGDEIWGLTMDDFSPEEDRFTSGDPAALGANLAVATLSDLLAAGAEPRFFMHAVSVPRLADPAFVEGLADGIGSVLTAAHCVCCGGDVGMSGSWRYCGFAMGPVVSGRPLTHRLPRGRQTLWVTGELGDANAAVLQGTETPRLQLRMEEAAAIRKHATGCIDTSGGLMDAIWSLHAMSPGLHFEIDAEAIPLAAGVREVAAAARLPAGAALLAGAGEY